VATSAGSLAATVTEPSGEAVGAVAIFQGWESLRAGPNGLWRRLAEALAAEGLVVLRADYPGLGESDPAPRGIDRTAVAAELLAWFRSKTADLPLHLLGWCYGSRVVLRLADRGLAVDGLVLVTPDLCRYLSDMRLDRTIRRFVGSMTGRFRRPQTAAGERSTRLRPLDGRLVDAFVETSRGFALRVLVGEHDLSRLDVESLMPRVEAAGGRVEVQVAPDHTLHTHGSRRSQAEIVARVPALILPVLEAGRGP
jgi:pimeloyl-ACP methyl ester carboxylesterase